jgi:hypothetical protein
LSSASIGSSYSFSSYNGYLSIPIGTADFLSGASINGISIYSPNTVYSGTSSNNFNNAIFIDPTVNSTATVHNTNSNTLTHNVTGNLVVPVFQSDYATTYYATVDSSGNVILPTGGVPSTQQTQVVYVPKGTSYQIFDATVDLSNWVGFLVIPVGSTDLLDVNYPNTDIDYTTLSADPYTVTDEYANDYIITYSPDLQDFLTARAGSGNYYYWGKSAAIKLNNFNNGNFYVPSFDSQSTQVKFPAGKKNPTLPGPSGGANYGVIAQQPGNTPLNPYSPPGYQPNTQNISN